MCLTTWDRKTDVPIANTMAFVVLMPEWMVLPIAGFPTKQIGRRFWRAWTKDLQKDRYREERKEGEK